MLPTFRIATPDDLAHVRRLLRELGYDDVDGETFGSVFAAVVARSDAMLLLGELATEVVALASVSFRPSLHVGGPLASLDEMVVSPSARGHGVGRAMIERVVAESISRGVRRLELTTNRARESYRRGFYAANGFVEAGSAVMRRELC